MVIITQYRLKAQRKPRGRQIWAQAHRSHRFSPYLPAGKATQLLCCLVLVKSGMTANFGTFNLFSYHLLLLDAFFTCLTARQTVLVLTPNRLAISR